MSDLFKQEQDRIRNAVQANKADGREALALLSPKGTIGAEFGVDTGQLSKRFLNLGHFSSFHSVDKWDDNAHSRFQYLAVCELLLPYEDSRVWRMTAQEFAELIPDTSLGFIYIDCYAHTGQDDGQVLHALWPKLKDDGIFAGDDYDKRIWPKTFRAVNEFATEHGATINIHEHGPYHSWYIYK